MYGGGIVIDSRLDEGAEEAIGEIIAPSRVRGGGCWHFCTYTQAFNKGTTTNAQLSPRNLIKRKTKGNEERRRRGKSIGGRRLNFGVPGCLIPAG